MATVQGVETVAEHSTCTDNKETTSATVQGGRQTTENHERCSFRLGRHVCPIGNNSASQTWERPQADRFVVEMIHAYEVLSAASFLRFKHSWSLHLHIAPAVHKNLPSAFGHCCEPLHHSPEGINRQQHAEATLKAAAAWLSACKTATCWSALCTDIGDWNASLDVV
jgi:hypothetical protein